MRSWTKSTDARGNVKNYDFWFVSYTHNVFLLDIFLVPLKFVSVFVTARNGLEVQCTGAVS